MNVLEIFKNYLNPVISPLIPSTGSFQLTLKLVLETGSTTTSLGGTLGTSE